jgi:hypothetical protein
MAFPVIVDSVAGAHPIGGLRIVFGQYQRQDAKGTWPAKPGIFGRGSGIALGESGG